MKASRLNQYRRMDQRQRVRTWPATGSRLKSDLKKALALPIMIVDDQSTILVITRGLLKKAGFTNIHVYQDPFAAVRDYSSLKPAIVITDLVMPGMRGSNLIARIAKASGRRPPRFIIRSGNALPEQGSSLGRMIDRFKVTYSQKGTYGFEDQVKKAARAVVKGIPPRPQILPAPNPSADKLAKNPFKQFLGGIAHKFGNLIVMFSNLECYEENAPDAEEIKADILESFASFLSFTTALASFAKRRDLAGANNFIDPPGDAQRYFFSVAPEQRERFGTVVDQYLNNEIIGLSKISDEIRALHEYLSTKGINNITVKVVSPMIDRLMGQLSALNRAVYLNDEAPPELVTLFTNYYLELTLS